MIFAYILGAFFVLIGVSVFFGAPYVPSHRTDVRRLFKHLKLSKKDTVLDLGSGDGLVLRAASRQGAKAVGYEIHPLFVAIAAFISRKDAHVRVRWANVWRANFPDDTTLVYMFAVGRDGAKFVKKIQQEVNKMGRPLRVVCYGNALPGLTPMQTFEAYFVYRFEPLH